METFNNTTLNAGLSTPKPASTSDAASTAASDFQSFLQLLTAQLRNQDPLSPLDSTQFVEQLASFSAVEQQIETNDRLADLANSLGGDDLSEAAQWVGQNVEVRSGAARFDGEPLRYVIPDGATDTRAVVVTDASGAEVYRYAPELGQREFTWNGETTDGEKAANGDYVVTVEDYDGETLVNVSEPIARAWVRQVRMEEDGIALVLNNGAVAAPSAVDALWAERDVAAAATE